MSELDFSDDVLLRVKLLLSLLDDTEEYLDPHGVDDSNNAEMNISFMMYILKDVLDFTGIKPEKEGLVARVAHYKFKLFTSHTESLSKYIGALDR